MGQRANTVEKNLPLGITDSTISQNFLAFHLFIIFPEGPSLVDKVSTTHPIRRS